MPRRLEDALAALYNKEAATVAICTYIEVIADNQHIVSRMGNQMPATALAHFIAPSPGTIVVCISSGNGLLLIGSIAD